MHARCGKQQQGAAAPHPTPRCGRRVLSPAQHRCASRGVSAAQGVLMSTTFGVIGSSRKIDEQRMPIHPDHLSRIPESLRRQLVFETGRSEEHTSELKSLMRISYDVTCLKKKKTNNTCTLNARTRSNENH